jgi:hypothetical protein
MGVGSVGVLATFFLDRQFRAITSFSPTGDVHTIYNIKSTEFHGVHGEV